MTLLMPCELIADVRGVGHGRVGSSDAPGLHGLGHAPAAGVVCMVLLVAERPDDDAGMIAVAADLRSSCRDSAASLPEQAVFVHDQHAQPVAGLEQFRRRRIVRGADRRCRPSPSAGDAEILQPSGRAAPTPAWSWWLHVPLISYGLPLSRNPLSASNATVRMPNSVSFAVHHLRRRFDGGDQLVKLGRFGRPENGRSRSAWFCADFLPSSRSHCRRRCGSPSPRSCRRASSICQSHCVAPAAVLRVGQSRLE